METQAASNMKFRRTSRHHPRFQLAGAELYCEMRWPHGGGSHPAGGDSNVTPDAWMLTRDNLFKRNLSAVI